MVVGAEGVWGSLLMFGIMLPLVQWLPGAEGQGIHEDSIDTLVMLRNSWPILGAVLLVMCTNAGYNVAGGCGGVRTGCWICGRAVQGGQGRQPPSGARAAQCGGITA